MENKPVIHDREYPVEASAGVDNAYYLHHCAALERPPSYAACLSRLADINAGRTNERTSECAKTLAEGRCTAAGMREQEKFAGSALFYFPRLKQPFLPAAVAGDFGVLVTNLTDPGLIPKATGAVKALAPVTHRAHRDGSYIGENDYASAINKAIVNLTTATPEAPASLADVALVVDDMAARGELPPVPPMVAPVDPYKAFQAQMAAGINPVAAATSIAASATAARPKMEPGETPLQYARRLAALKNPT